MATTYTTNYHLGKQTNHADRFDMDVLTDDMDIIDAALKENADFISDVITALGGLSFVKCTQVQYDAMASHDANTVYIIVG